MSTIVCPHCDGTITISVKVQSTSGYAILTADHLVAALNADSRRDVYACEGGGFAVSYGGGAVWPRAILDALEQHRIAEKYPGKQLEVWRLA